jgi:hypothetical protein
MIGFSTSPYFAIAGVHYQRKARPVHLVAPEDPLFLSWGVNGSKLERPGLEEMHSFNTLCKL